MLLISLSFLFEIKMSFYSHPACRHADRTISSLASASVRRVVSEDSGLHQSFLLIDCTVRFSLPLAVERRVPTDTQLFQHIAKFY